MSSYLSFNGLWTGADHLRPSSPPRINRQMLFLRRCLFFYKDVEKKPIVSVRLEGDQWEEERDTTTAATARKKVESCHAAFPLGKRWHAVDNQRQSICVMMDLSLPTIWSDNQKMKFEHLWMSADESFRWACSLSLCAISAEVSRLQSEREKLKVGINSHQDTVKILGSEREIDAEWWVTLVHVCCSHYAHRSGVVGGIEQAGLG